MSSWLNAVSVFVVVPHVYVPVAAALALSRGRSLVDGHFTRPKFYLLMGWVPLTFGLLGLLVDVRYLAMFAVCGLAGIVGEVIVSAAWRLFFGEAIWTYSHGALMSGITSTLNFLPWAAGAFLFHAAVLLLGWTIPGRWLVVGSAAAAAAVLVTWVPYLLLTRRQCSQAGRRFSGAGFGLFCAPIAVAALAIALFCDPRALWMMALFAAVGFSFEYGYGRAMSLFFERSLWTYNRWRIDGGHASFVSLPLWALGGLYFEALAGLLGLTAAAA